MGQSSKPMEQHSHKLNYKDKSEEEHKHQSNWLQLQILLADVDL